jgi:aminoglycoside phosphotransferase (APT) family kinase protein
VVVGGDITIVERPGRVGGLEIRQRPGDCWFVKRVVDRSSLVALEHEARALRLLGHDERLSGLAPRRCSFDPGDGLLVRELVEGRPVCELAAPTDAVVTELGHALAAIRAHEGIGRATGQQDRAERPWALSMHRPSAADLRWLSPASRKLIRDLQAEPDVGRQLDAVRHSWRDASFIHGDVRWTNVILRTGGATGGWGIALVDWESAGLGDPRWDQGCVLAQLLSDGLLAILAARESGASVPPAHDAAELGAVRNRVRRLSEASAVAGTSGEDSDSILRAVTFAGVRLMQFGIEIAQDHAAPTPRSVIHMQTGANVLRDPSRAAFALFGLPEPGSP